MQSSAPAVDSPAAGAPARGPDTPRDTEPTVLSIQVLRGLAATAVLIFHAAATFLLPAQIQHSFAVLAGGVDVFFVISGFVMVHATQGRKHTFASFMRARIWRIVPIYWITLLLAALLIRAEFGAFPEWREILQSYLFIPYTNPRNGLPAPYLVPGWTLNYEMFFYLAFGATLFLGTATRQLAVLVGAFALLVVAHGWVGHWGAAADRFTSPLLFEFLGGMALAILWPRLRSLPLAGALALIVLAVVGFAAAATVTEHWPRTVRWGIPSVFLVAGALGIERYLREAALRPLLFLGAASYSLYLTHLLTIDAVRLLGAGEIEASPLVTVAMARLALARGCAFYVLIERPLMVLGRQRRSADVALPRYGRGAVAPSEATTS